MPGSLSGILDAGLMSWEQRERVGEFYVLGPNHPKNSRMAGLSPCSKNRGEQIPGGGVGDERVEFTRGILLKAEGAAGSSPPLLPHPAI